MGQSGNIIGIARDKNGFIEYLKEAQYADIKLNVVIKGKHNSIIGEVQFLLRAMKEYKEVAHNLYSVQRKEESFKTSVRPTLPILLNQQNEIFGIACSGNVKEMCALMILQNQSIKDLMFVDKKSGQNLFHKVCVLGHLKLLLFLESMLDRNEFIDHIFLCSKNDDENPIEYAVEKSHPSIVKHLFDKNEVQARYENNDPMLHRLFIFLFAMNSDPHVMEYVMSALQITKEKVIKMLSYKCPKQGNDNSYHNKNILTAIVWTGSFDHLKRFVDVIGEQSFIDNVFNQDKYDCDLMNWAVDRKRMKIMEYVLSIGEIKQKYLTDNNELYVLCASLNEFIVNKEAVQYVVDTLGLTEAKLTELKSFRNIDIEKILPFTKNEQLY